MIRTFVALLLPPAWTAYLARVREDLAPRTSGMSWVQPGNIHMTLRFLGDLGEDGARRAGESVLRGAEGVPAPVARLGGLGGFPSLDRPRVLWMGLESGADGTVALARAVNDALRRDGFGPPDKPFRPHLTLARVREGARGLEAVRAYAVPPPPEASVLDLVAVMKSDLHPAGARYTPLTEVRLRH